MGTRGAVWTGVMVLALPLALIGSVLTFVMAVSSTGGCSGETSGDAVTVDTTRVPPGPIGAGRWSGDQLVNAALIINAGSSLGLSQRDQTIGVMTAMGESALKVLDHGDSVGPDSRGLFQQRSAGWGSLECRMNPTCSAQTFFRALAKVKNRASLSPTMTAHTVQRNADPGHYTTYWADAQKVVAMLAGVEDSAADGDDADTGVDFCSPGWSGSQGDWSTTINFALGMVGKVKYAWGGGGLNGPTVGDEGWAGFDCSSFVRFVVFQTTHRTLPRTSRGQAAFFQSKGLVHRTTDPRTLQPGDIVFFSHGDSVGSIYHVALVTKAGWIVEEPGRGRYVQHNEIAHRMPDDVWGYARFSVTSLS